MVSKELELWQFAASRLNKGEDVMLLVVATSSGSSPGRAGYKMAVAADGELWAASAAAGWRCVWSNDLYLRFEI